MSRSSRVYLRLEPSATPIFRKQRWSKFEWMGTDSHRMLQNTNVPENSQRIGAGMPGVVTWGVIGGGDSARRFAAGLRYVTGAKLTSVWTRKREVAEAFAAHFGGATTCTLE